MNLSECEIDDEGNIIDPITLDVIDENRLISFKQNNKIFCFDIDSLYRYIRNQNNPINPLTRIPLEEKIIEKLYIYGENFKVKIDIKTLFVGGISFYVDKDIRLGDLAIEINRKMGTLNSIYDYKIIYNRKSIYSYDLNEKLEDITNDNIVTLHVTTFLNSKEQSIIYEKLYPYSVQHNIYWLENLIPIRFKLPIPQIDEPTDTIVDEIFDYLSNINPNSNTIYDDLLTLLSSAKITADNAHNMDILISRLPLNNDHIHKLLHLLYSRVVDKFNLISGSGIQHHYYRDIYQRPSYRLYRQ